MVNINKNIKKVCSFYVSDWHLTTMLLPHINEKINEGVKITTILENDLRENMETLLGKLKLKNTEKILNIDWNKTKDIEKKIKEITNEEEVIINGSMEFIRKANELLQKEISEGVTIKVIDCYDFNEYKEIIKDILDEHETVLNTSGEKSKEEYIIKIAN